jgi:hypothetical protein
MERKRPPMAPSFTVHEAVPVESVTPWHSSLPMATNHTTAPETGSPPELNVALNENTWVLPIGTGAATTSVLGAWSTEKTVDVVLEAKSPPPE